MILFNVCQLVKFFFLVPGLSPRVDVGSFHIANVNDSMEIREAYIYWQDIPEKQQNGEDFSYNVRYVEPDGERVPIRPMRFAKIFAKYEVSFYDHRLEITSVNSVGVNEDPNIIYIPSIYDSEYTQIVQTFACPATLARCHFPIKNFENRKVLRLKNPIYFLAMLNEGDIVE